MNSNKTEALVAPSTAPMPGDISSLYPAIVECFTIILCGYVSGRAGWIASTHSKGLSKFTSMFALPALLFSNMAVLDWSQVEWSFLMAIFLSKAVMFIVTGGLALMISRPSNIGLAALVGIFTTQQNDFALGYPIVQAIYSQTQPQFLQYIYLIAPISLVILNPVGFILLEIHRARRLSGTRGRCNMLLNVLKEITTNPIIVMTALGLAANFVFNHTLPSIIANLLDTFGKAFSACALFVLGHSIVGKMKGSSSKLFIASGLLIFAKLLCFPILTVQFTRALGCGKSTNSTAEYSMFAFLYGTFPSAPSVLLYAHHYSTGIDLVATSLVLGTVASAPLMFTSAMMFGMQVFTVNIASVLNQTFLDVSILSIICCICLVVLFIVTKRSCRMPHFLVLLIAIAQMSVAVGVIIQASARPPNTSSELEWWEYIYFIMQTTGMLAVSCMTTVCAITELLLSKYSLCKALVYRPWLLCYGLGAPVISTSFILLIGSLTEIPQHGPLNFGDTQLAVTSVVMIVNILVSVVIMIVSVRTINSQHAVRVAECGSASVQKGGSSKSSGLSESSSSRSSYGACSSSSPDSPDSSCSTKKQEDGSEKDVLVSIEDIVPFLSQSDNPITDDRRCAVSRRCSPEQRRRCKNLLVKYEKTHDEDDFQLTRLTGLVLLLILFQVTAVLFFMWKLALPDLVETSIFVEVEFIYAVLSSGQGFFTFIIYGLDSQLILYPIKRFLLRSVRRMRGRRAVDSSRHVSSQSERICHQFRHFHLRQCDLTISTTISGRDHCFEGRLLFLWLINAGLCCDEVEAQQHCWHLLAGQVIQGAVGKCSNTVQSDIVYQFHSL